MTKSEMSMKFPGAVLRSRNDKWPILILQAGDDSKIVIKVPMEDGTSREYSLDILHDIERLASFTAALCYRLNDMVDSLNCRLGRISATTALPTALPITPLASRFVDNRLTKCRSDIEAGTANLSDSTDAILVKDLPLSVRAFNVLNVPKLDWKTTLPPILTVGDLCKHTENDLRKYQNCGRKTINEIKAVLAKHGKELAK